MSFRKAVMYSLILFATIPILCMSVINLVIVTYSFAEQVDARFETLAVSNGSAFDTYLNGQKREIELMSGAYEIIKCMENPSEEDMDTAYSFLSHWVNSVSFYDNAILVDLDGNIVVSVDRQIDFGNNLYDLPYFQDALNQEETLIADYATSPLDPEKQVCTMSHTIIDSNGQKHGVVVLFVSVDFFNDLTRRIKAGENNVTFIINAQNEIIFSSNEVQNHSIAANSSLSNLITDYNNQKRQKSDVVTYLGDNIRYKAGYYVLDELNWAFVFGQEYWYIFRNIVLIITTNILILLASLAIAIYASSYLSGEFSKPIHKLRDAFTKATRKDDYITCNINVNNEFGELADSYNVMISKLSKSHDDIMNAYQELSHNEELLKHNNLLLAEEQRHTEYLVNHDIGTGLLNKFSIEKQLQSHLDNHACGVLLLVDVDDFKAMNDAHGHDSGDVILRQISTIFKDPVLGLDSAARVGGDEFLLLKLGRHDIMPELIQKVEALVEKPIMINDSTIYYSVSIGIVMFGTEDTDASIVINHADMAMYQAKALGKNTHYYYDEKMKLVLDRQKQILQVLRTCIQRKELFLCYQPIVSMQTGRIIGLETLMRINSHELGLIPPDEFIPIAETNGLILRQSYWLLEHACRFAKRLVDQKIEFGVLSINISSLQLVEKDFTSKILETLDVVGLEPKYLQIEITESILKNRIKISMDKLTLLRSYGVTIALDDFGTAYSSLSYLIHLPIDVIKIDKSFIEDIMQNEKKYSITKAIIGLSHTLGFSVIAEGVETKNEWEQLKELGCDLYQGYYYARPVEEDSIVAIVQDANGC